MITADPGRRQAVLDEIHTRIARDAPAEQREMLHAFAANAYAEMPDSMALGLPVDALMARIRAYFHFFVVTMPPSHQLYRALPGLHVQVRNPDESERHATGSTHGGHYDITIVETHTPDAPFLFESLKNFFQKEGIRVFSAIHPIFTVRRQWERMVWVGGPLEDGSKELMCHFRVERIESKERLRRLEHQIFSMLKSVFLAVEDYQDMTRTVHELAGRLRHRRGEPGGDAAARAFLQWLQDDNYVLLGTLRFRRGADGFGPDYDSALGAFREPALLPVVFPGVMEEEQAHVNVADDDDRILDIDFRNNAGAIHHLEPVDDIVVREWDADGRLAAATVLLGRLAKGAFTAKAESIPLLHQKLEWLLDHCGALRNSHAYRETRALFNHFPKRELFYADTASLKAILDRMVYMSSDDEIAVTVRHGSGYTAACIAFSDLRYSPKAEQDLKLALAAEFGPIKFHTSADCGATTLLLYYFDDATLGATLDVARVERITGQVISTWEDHVAHALEQSFGNIEGRRLFRRYVRQESRSGLYRELTSPAEVPDDLRHFEALEGQLELGLLPGTAETMTLKLFSPRPIGLTDILRTLQNLGLTVREEVNMPLVLPENRKAWLERLTVEGEPTVIAAIHREGDRLRDALRAVQEERATDDALNALVLREGLTWRDVEVLRTLRNHLLQIRTNYTAETVTAVLLRNGRSARALFDAFDARFNPARESERQAVVAASDEGLDGALRAVGSLFDDEILRGLANLLHATVRTNFYQRPERPVISIKVESAKVEGMVSPRPLFEIYVHSRLLQGIHLRGGKVARGGIRWSDRHDDFRTEILGLMKTQMVKNAVIVPVGSKGGFVLKGDVPPRPALEQYLIDRYREFVSGLLDVTDNLVDGKVLHPPEVVRLDEPDPYLVVAADKGTAHLSDTANRVSAQYGFWLGDAFASGGSNGYDHKKEGITARGAWECVRHLFQTLGVDVQTQPFTMAGVGDMSGDVFGNGALRSRTTRLVAAFNHVHIFLDPQPDAERSFVERERLFRLPRSSWRDYDPSLVSAGGGVFDRSAKAIPLSPAVRELLDLHQEAASGEEVVRAILRARVDLLYNGGIGTYVKASTEDDATVGDRGNDRVRVDASTLRARVVGEGGNLGFTQHGRIEYWMGGGLINTDAVDNSGGVDMSDHEVNIKILLDLLMRNGVIKNRAERNRVLAEMTDEVSHLVLADNQNQSVALSLAGLRSARHYEQFIGFVEDLVAAGIMSRVDDGVPTMDALLASPARDRGLPRPLLCVMMGNIKNWAFARVLPTGLPDCEVAQPFLETYFPTPMRQTYREHLALHPLRREIVATVAVNHVVNHAGLRFLHKTMRTTGREIGDVLEAYLVADRASRAAEVRAEIEATPLPMAERLARLLELSDVLETATVKLLLQEPVDLAGALDGVRAAGSR